MLYRTGGMKINLCIISDSWGAYIRLGDEFTHYAVNHSIDFVNSYTGTHTSTIGAISKHVKVSMKGALYLLPGRDNVWGSMPFMQIQSLSSCFHPHCQQCGLVSASSTPPPPHLHHFASFALEIFQQWLVYINGAAHIIILPSLCEIPLETKSRVISKFILSPSYFV
jgi:hypothetical protein